MKIAVISDIHVDINREYPVVDCLAFYVKEQHADLLLVAGDLSEHADETIETAALLEQKSGCRVFYVPGNHDMWSEDFDKADTDSIYKRYLEDPRCLSGSIQLLRGTNGPFALIGDIGWYDYSFSNAFYPEEELEKFYDKYAFSVERNISHILTVSTGHISKKTRDLLTRAAHGETYFPVAVYEKGKCGFYLYVPDEMDDTLPVELKHLLQITKSLGCEILCLDSDGSVLPNMEHYNW